MLEISKVIDKIEEGLNNLRDKKPLIHHLTNHVVMSDCANITLHIGGAPVMTLAPQETEDMVSVADALVLNIGTLTEEYVSEMIYASKAAQKQNIPVLLDPVGAGATPMRTEAANRILREGGVDIIKGNAGEVSVLAGVEATVRGVDSINSSMEAVEVARKLAHVYQSVVAITGETDWVADKERVFKVANGDKMLSSLVGTGCMLDSITASFAAVMEDKLLAALAALVSMGVAAELAVFEREGQGPASFKNALFDEIYALDGAKIRKYASIEEVNDHKS